MTYSARPLTMRAETAPVYVPEGKGEMVWTPSVTLGKLSLNSINCGKAGHRITFRFGEITGRLGLTASIQWCVSSTVKLLFQLPIKYFIRAWYHAFMTKNESFLSSLNDEQVKAVTHGNGPILILAGAG